MRLKKLVKRFDFSNDERRNVTLGSGVRLAYERQQLELIAINNVYSTAPDLFAKTRLTTPNTCKGWIGFECEAKMKKNGAGTVVTSLGFRLSRDGTTQLWWNGAAWAAAAPGQWNTEAQICANIAAFTGQAIQVIVNLKTSDGAYTPEVQAVKLLWNSDIEFQQEYIARSVIPAMREEILPISDYAVDLPAIATTLDLKKIETPYNIVSIDCVYNLTDDPTKQTDILSGYNPTTKVVTFASVGAGKRVLVRFVYSPEVVIVQSQDFVELSKVPAICIESIVMDEAYQIDPGESVINRATGSGWQLQNGFQQDINFTVRYMTDKTADLDTLADQVKKFFYDRVLRCRGQDEYVSMYITEEYSHQPSALQSELHSARLRARICKASFFPRDAVPVFGVQRFLVQMNGEQVAAGVIRIFWGNAVDPGVYNSAFANSLQTALKPVLNGTYHIVCAASESAFFWVPTAYGLTTDAFTVDGFDFDCSKVASAVTVTLPGGGTAQYDCFRSTNVGFGDIDLVVAT